MDKQTLWDAVLSELELDVSRASFNSWLKPTSLIALKDVDNKRQIITIACRSFYQQNIVEARYYGQIKHALDRLTEKKNELVFAIAAQAQKASEPVGPLFNLEKKADDISTYQRAVGRVRLRQDYVFDTFAVSSTNEMAHAAASAVAREPGGAYQILFFYGGVGVGKTHLMTAVGHEILRAEPDIEMIYCSGEEFMNELVEAIQNKKTTAFKNKFRRAKVLLVDDIQFIAGKDAAQEEFFHTFNAIFQNHGQIVLTSDRLPEEMVRLEDRLRSRFEGGLIIDIQEPNFELRTAILNIKAKVRGLKLPSEMAQMAAAQITSTRRLEGFLARLISETEAKEEAVTPEIVERLLGNLGEKPTNTKKYIPPQDIIEAVADYFSLKPSVVKGKKRTKGVISARHAAMFLLKEDINLPFKEVGRVIGGRDHTTVMHAVDKIKTALNTSMSVRRDIEALRKKVFGSL